MPVYPLMMVLLLNALLLQVAAAMNSTFIPLPMDEEGHHPGRQLLWDSASAEEPHHFQEFRNSKPDMVEINGQLYKIEKKIGTGGAGTVYKATYKDDDGTTIEVAIKLITPRGTHDEKELIFGNAKKEIDLSTALGKNKNVVTILNSEVKSSSLAIVMEYCTSNLNEWIRWEKWSNGMPKRLIDTFVPFLSSAVQQLRAHGIVHFDPKPQNILECDGVWKVANFDRPPVLVKDGKTQDSGVVSDGFSSETDLYSVGVILNILVEKKKYVPGASLQALKYFIRQLLDKQFSLQDFYDYANQLVVPFAAFISKTHVEINGMSYRIGPYISKGSFGSVYKATQVNKGLPGKLVAIKLISYALAGSELLKKATSEIGFLEDLKKSDNVVNILNWEVRGSSVAIVMEYCTTDLQGWLETEDVYENGLTPERVIAEFVPFLSSAVEQMHDKNIVHFDLKPGNVLQCGGVWKVTDFDLAQHIEEDVQVSWKGTTGYTDPDVLPLGNGIATPMTDMYSVGALLYTLVTGQKYEEDQDLNYKWSRPEYEPLGKFIQKLLNKKFETFDEFLKEAIFFKHKPQ